MAFKKVKTRVDWSRLCLELSTSFTNICQRENTHVHI